MALLARVRMQWQGMPSGIGHSIFHFRDASTPPGTTPNVQNCLNRVDTFAANIRSLLAPSLNLQVDPTVDIIEDTTGEMVDADSGSVLAPHVGSAADTAYASPSGAVITWRTNEVRNSRRVRGRTFIVPLSKASYDTTGSLFTATINTLATAATNLINPATAAEDLFVYVRPVEAQVGPPAVPGRLGEGIPVVTYSVPDLVAILRSRRD